MNLLLIIAGAALILAAGLILKGRKNQADRNARYKAPRTPLKLDRASAGLDRSGGGRSPLLSKARPSSSAAPIMLGLVLMVLSLWLAAAYLRPSAESAETGAAASRPASPPPQSTQVGTLAGRLSTPEQPAPATGQTAPAPVAAQTPPPLPASGARASALNQTAATGVDDSALNQVGLMPTRRQAASTAAAPTAAPKPAAEQARRPAAETKPPADSAAKPNQIQPPPASANSNLVRALSGPPPGEAGAQAAPAAASRSGILSGTEGFTVHLGSFVDQANAEKFRNKLTDAGEPAAIYEINMDGRLWYRVLSGRFNTRAEADAHGRDLRRRGLTDDSGPFIVKPINSDN